MPPAKAKRSSNAPSIVRPLRRVGAIPKSSMQASTAPPFAYHGMPLGDSLTATQAVVWVAVVAMVSVAVTAAVEVMLTGLVVKVNVGMCRAPDGLLATVAVRVTLPVKPLVGEMVMVELSPVVA